MSLSLCWVVATETLQFTIRMYCWPGLWNVY
jgi:hypothetical protein